MSCQNILSKVSFILAPEDPKIQLDFNKERYQRKQNSEFQKEIEEFIETNWSLKSAQNPKLYNASKFRLHDFTVDSNRVVIQVGLTSYKELLGTHYHPKVEELTQDQNWELMSNCMGVGAIALTSDNFVILQKRAAWTGEYPDKIDRPGGHPEPANVVPEFTNQAVLTEIFKSPQEELRDEVNIRLEQQSSPRLLGVVRDLEHGGRVALDFLIDVDLSQPEVLAQYRSGNQTEADESSELIFIQKDKIKNWDLPDDLALNLTAHATAGLLLLHLVLNQ